MNISLKRVLMKIILVFGLSAVLLAAGCSLGNSSGKATGPWGEEPDTPADYDPAGMAAEPADPEFDSSYPEEGLVPDTGGMEEVSGNGDSEAGEPPTPEYYSCCKFNVFISIDEDRKEPVTHCMLIDPNDENSKNCPPEGKGVAKFDGSFENEELIGVGEAGEENKKEAESICSSKCEVPPEPEYIIIRGDGRPKAGITHPGQKKLTAREAAIVIYNKELLRVAKELDCISTGPGGETVEDINIIEKRTEWDPYTEVYSVIGKADKENPC